MAEGDPQGMGTVAEYYDRLAPVYGEGEYSHARRAAALGEALNVRGNSNQSASQEQFFANSETRLLGIRRAAANESHQASTFEGNSVPKSKIACPIS